MTPRERVLTALSLGVPDRVPWCELAIDPEVARRQVERLQEAKKNRDSAQVNRSLQRLDDAVRGDENTLPVLIECVEAYATVGEMCDVMREVFGTQREFVSI